MALFSSARIRRDHGSAHRRGELPDGLIGRPAQHPFLISRCSSR